MSSQRAGSDDDGDVGASNDIAILDELVSSGARVGELIDSLNTSSDTTVREQVEELIQSFDVLHREAMVRITSLLARQHLLEQACTDPVLSFVFELYDLTPEQLREAAKPIEAAATGGLIKLGDIRRIPATPPPEQSQAAPEGSTTEQQ